MEITAKSDFTFKMSKEEFERLALVIQSGIYYKQDLVKEFSAHPEGPNTKLFSDLSTKHQSDINFAEIFLQRVAKSL